MKKIKTVLELSSVIKQLKKKNKKIVLCHGVFDLLHYGHILHFNAAKKYGDILIVSITADKYVKKGPGRPLFSEKIRKNFISSLSVVDFVVSSEENTAVKIIKSLKPDFYCKGIEYKDKNDDITGEIVNEVRAIKSVNGKIIYTDEKQLSSSTLINQHLNTFSENQLRFIKILKKNLNFFKIRHALEDCNKLKVLVIGEALIDRYAFCEPLGKSGKDPMLVFKENKVEEYLGGSLAIANNLFPFCKKITVLSSIGENKEYLNFIKNKIRGKIKLKLLYKKNSPTIIKTKFLDSVSYNKVFGINKINDDLLSLEDEKKFIQLLNNEIKKNDLVIVSDYGHGLITKKIASLIVKNSKFLAVNAQINSANLGFHTLRNYKKSDCCVINEKELRYEMRNRNKDIKDLMKSFIKTHKTKNLIVSQGNRGSKILIKNINKVFHLDAFTKTAIDKVGAGDTMLAFLSILLKNKSDPKVALFVSSIAAAISVQNFANKSSIDKISLFKSIDHMLK